MSLAERLSSVQSTVIQACRKANRLEEAVGLIAVSKTRTIQHIQDAVQLGQIDFGENYAQELRDKASLLHSSHPEIRWHYIGRIQRNKAKYIAPNAYRIHTLENVDQATALLKRAPKGIDALLAINIGDEAQKSGLSPEQAIESGKALTKLEGCRIHGLMCIPPIATSREANRAHFEEMAHLLQKGQAAGLPWTELSMGMSGDYEIAIDCGATWIRVGTAIFGPRTQ